MKKSVQFLDVFFLLALPTGIEPVSRDPQSLILSVKLQEPVSLYHKTGLFSIDKKTVA